MKEKNEVDKLITIFNGDVDLALFYLAWIKNGLNASKAYKELHPEVKAHSADTLGSRLLKKVDKSAILDAYGLDQELYFKQLKEGVQAMKTDHFTGEQSPDHKTREKYHDKLGKQLGLEQDKVSILQQFNIGGKSTVEWIEDDK